jgi:hypothetical protein
VAAIGTVESNNGQSNAPGVHSGANYAGAEGPMQMLPATFAEYALPVPPDGAEPPSPYDPVDAEHAAVRDLCANGGRNHTDILEAIFAYNHADWYVTEVLQPRPGSRARPAERDGPETTHNLGLTFFARCGDNRFSDFGGRIWSEPVATAWWR